MIFDSHCHLQFKKFKDDREEVIERCREKNTKMILVGTQQDTSKQGVKLAEKNEDMYASVGLHPIQSKQVEVEEEDTSFVAKGEDFDKQYYQELIEDSDEVVAIGETGLDKHHIPDNLSTEKAIEAQWSAYLKQIKLAREYDLPVIMHIRNAHDEMIARLKNIDTDYKGVIHCFTSNWSHAKEYLKLGFNISFTGIITFPPKSSNPKVQHDLWEAVAKTTLEKIMVETDSPFLAPQKYRGETAEPWMVKEVVKKVADIKDITCEKVRTKTVANTKQFFKI